MIKRFKYFFFVLGLCVMTLAACDGKSSNNPAGPTSNDDVISSSSRLLATSSSNNQPTLSSSSKVDSIIEVNPNLSSSSKDLSLNSSSSLECMKEVQSHVVVAKLSEYINPEEHSCREGLIVFANQDMLLATCRDNAWDTTVVVPCSSVQNPISSAQDEISSSSRGYEVNFSFADSSYSWQFGNPKVKYGKMLDERNNHVYRTVTLGSQTWMAENLNFGDEKTVVYYDDYSCYQGDHEEIAPWEYACDLTGGYYEWYSAMGLSVEYNRKVPEDGLIKNTHRGVCPNGWHIPTIAEWKVLFIFVDANNGNDSVATSLKTVNIYNGDGSEDSFYKNFNWSKNV